MPTPTPRLMRSRTEKILAGVAGGLAGYLAIDPVLIRLLFIALLCTGVGIILYPILWLVMPIEPAASATTFSMAGDAGREVFVAPGSAMTRARFDPMTGQPIDPNDAGEEIPINNVDTPHPDAAPPAHRQQLLGYALLIVGSIILVSLITGLSGLFAKILFPVILIGVGVYLLRRNP